MDCYSNFVSFFMWIFFIHLNSSRLMACSQINPAQLVYYYNHITQLKNMSVRYNTDSDNIKCNFCTTYFSCSLNFANVQRYSLKVCHKCFNNFAYYILHPSTYKIYKVLLVDMGVVMPIQKTTANLSEFTSNQFRTEFERLKQQIESSIALHYEEKIRQLIKQNQKIKQYWVQSFGKLQAQYKALLNSKLSKENEEKVPELRRKLEIIKNYEIEDLIQLATRRSDDPKNLRALLSKSRKNSCQASSDKQNIESANRYNVANSIKSRVKNQPSTLVRMLSSRSKSKGYDQSRISNKSVIRSIKLDADPKSSRKLSQSIYLAQNGNGIEDLQRQQIAKLLEQKQIIDSYMSKQVSKPVSVASKGDGNRNIIEGIIDMKNRTIKTGELVELVGGDASKVNFGCYLRSLKEMQGIKTVRIIRCSLVDADMDQLLHFLSQSNTVQTLIVTNNKLTQLSVEAVYNFKQRHPQSNLKNVYLGNNHIGSWKFSNIVKKQQSNLVQIQA